MKIEKIILEPSTSKETNKVKKIRVAAYCRVSTDTEEQKTSFDNQVKVYTDMIEAKPDWTLAGIYADEGLSGTSVSKRKQFLKMIRDCEEGKIDIIVTKSISRFARNTLECLTYVRHLKDIGVHIIFENNNIDTRTVLSEMLLTVLAAFAQEESRSISLNTIWGIRKRYEEGTARWSKLYGYEKNKNGEYQIVPEQARVVKEIFSLYEHGESLQKIMKHLQRKLIPTPAGAEKWSVGTVRKIIMNERYCGDIFLQKTICENHITHKAIKNDATKVPSYFIENHHEALISPKQFYRCKHILEMRRNPHPDKPEEYYNQYPLGDKLRCPYCGSRLFKRKLRVQKVGSGWCCEVGEHACRQFIIRTYIVESALINAYHTLDISFIEKRLDSQRFGDAAENMLKIKSEYPRMKRVDYWWVDELVDHIEFGKHYKTTKELAAQAAKGTPDIEDRIMKVYWRCGLVTTVPSGVNDDTEFPRRVAELNNKLQMRLSEKKPMNKKKYKGSAKNEDNKNPQGERSA